MIGLAQVTDSAPHNARRRHEVAWNELKDPRRKYLQYANQRTHHTRTNHRRGEGMKRLPSSVYRPTSPARSPKDCGKPKQQSQT